VVDAARARKLADRIKVVVAETLEMRVKDPRLGFITITDVRLTGDLQQATVFYTVFGDDTQQAGHAHGAGEREGRAALGGRQADRGPAHAVAGVHRRRRPRDGRHIEDCWPRWPSPTPRCTGPRPARRTPVRPIRTRRRGWTTTRTTPTRADSADADRESDG
jgi:ribosome-binding factor A